MILFFQAEDGIRDLTVTGVQTCALPISRDRTRVLVGGAGGGRGESGGEQQAQAGGREGHGASGVKRATGTRAARAARRSAIVTARRAGRTPRASWAVPTRGRRFGLSAGPLSAAGIP